MNTNKQDKLATDLGSRALSVKTNGEQPADFYYPFGRRSDDDQKEAVMDVFFRSLNVTLNAIGMNISAATLGFDRSWTTGACYRGLVKAQLVPAVPVLSINPNEDVPDWFKGNVC